MKRKLVTIISMLLLFITSSCDDESNSLEDPQSLIDSRKEFVSNKNFAEIKDSFSNLPKSEKIILWQSKLTQLSSLQLSQEHLTLISKLQTQLSKETLSGSEIKQIAIELAKITPEEEFIQMFSSLDDYNSSIYFDISKINNHHIIRDLESIEYFLDEDIHNNAGIFSLSALSSLSSTPKCNCRWTCSIYENFTSQGDNCSSTRYGCGFLWLQSCEEHV